MKLTFITLIVVAMVTTALPSQAQKDKDEGPTSLLNFLVIKDDNGKPVRNAAVVLHPVNPKGKQERGGLELKTDPDGKTNFDGVPYGILRVQVLAQGFQTYGEDFDIEKPTTDITIKLKRPQGQYSIYDDHAKDSNPPPKQDSQPPSNAGDKKPN
jgi:Carboxypeptidase regulatory-like domain